MIVEQYLSKNSIRLAQMPRVDQKTSLEYVDDSIFFHCNKKQDTKKKDVRIHLKREEQWCKRAELG